MTDEDDRFDMTDEDDRFNMLERNRELWPGDEKLAALNKKFGIKAPTERIIRTDIIATAFNRERLLPRGERIVDLACGHFVVAKIVQNRKRCYLCQDMFDRGADYDLFRHGAANDR